MDWAGPQGRAWRAGLVWAVGWGAMLWLDGRVDLGNLAMVLVLSSAQIGRAHV